MQFEAEWHAVPLGRLCCLAGIYIPGITFTTAIRDFHNGDYLSGTIHLIDALLTALCIAVGIIIPMAVFRSIGGGGLLP